MRTARYLALIYACAAWGCYPDHQVVETARSGGQPSASMSEHAGAAGAVEAELGGGGGAALGAAGGAPGCAGSQSVLVGQVTNARDLGGTPVSPAGHVACGSLYRGAPLKALTEQGCAAVAELGIRTVIDLRTEPERSASPNTSCVKASYVLAPLPVPYGLSAADYLNDLNETASIAAAFHVFADPAAYPIYFHCTWGRDRTGVVAAVLLLALGVSREDVMREYLLSQASVGAYPNSLEAVLDEVERRGGADAFLTSLGISEPELAVLREHGTTLQP